MRGVSYSMGAFGLDWVCHQTANAYTGRKWGILVVDYPISWARFGPAGRRGVSQRSHFGVVHKGCVPANGCYYNSFPLFSSAARHALLEALGEGHGYGLQLLYNPVKGVIQSGADFTVHFPAIPGVTEVHIENVP
jgi:hypothetical protein